MRRMPSIKKRWQARMPMTYDGDLEAFRSHLHICNLRQVGQGLRLALVKALPGNLKCAKSDGSGRLGPKLRSCCFSRAKRERRASQIITTCTKMLPSHHLPRIHTSIFLCNPVVRLSFCWRFLAAVAPFGADLCPDSALPLRGTPLCTRRRSLAIISWCIRMAWACWSSFMYSS